MSSTRAEQSSISSSLTRLDRDSWLQTEDALIGILGDKDAKAPLIVTREEYVEGRTLGLRGEGLIQERIKYGNDYDKENDQVHNVLSIVFRNCGEARAILHKYRAGGTIEDVLTITILGCIQLPTGRVSLIHPDGYATGLETCTTDMGPDNGTVMVPMETGVKWRQVLQ